MKTLWVTSAAISGEPTCRRAASDHVGRALRKVEANLIEDFDEIAGMNGALAHVKLLLTEQEQGEPHGAAAV